MLKLKYLIENFDLARFALNHWPHDEATLADRLKWFRISSNAVYPFDIGGRLCFLRLSPAKEKSADALRAELAFLTYLRDQDYPALRVIRANGGETLLTLDTPWGIWHACAFTGAPGRPIEDIPLTETVLTHYGAALGQLHALSMAYAPALRRQSYEDVLQWIANTLRSCGAPDFMLRECRAVAGEMADVPRTEANYGLVHYDFEPDNVFWDGEGCHVIDFDDSMYHFYAVDLVQALDELPPEAAGPFLRGYREACPASDAQEADFPLLRRFRDLYSYARLMHSLSERPRPEPDWMPGLVSRLTAKGRQIEQNILAK